MFEFFRVWLIVVGAGIAAFGIGMALLAGTRVFEIMNRLIDPAFWRTAPDEPVRKFQAWSYAVTGAVMAGWGVTVAVLAWQAFPAKQAWSWWAVAGGVALWFVLDTAQSLRHRVYANAGINFVVFVTVAIPLIGTFSEFR